MCMEARLRSTVVSTYRSCKLHHMHSRPPHLSHAAHSSFVRLPSLKTVSSRRVPALPRVARLRASASGAVLPETLPLPLSLPLLSLSLREALLFMPERAARLHD